MRYAILALLIAGPASATTFTLDFQEEAIGDRGTSFVSAECPCVTLSEANGGEMSVRPHFPSSTNLVLWAGEEGGALRISFAVPVSSVMVEFGDSGGAVHAFHPPVLKGYMGGTVVTEATLPPNMDGEMNESLTIRGAAFDMATFHFVQYGEHEPRTAPVGRIVFTVPEPAAAGLLLAAGSVLLARGRCRSRSARSRSTWTAS